MIGQATLTGKRSVASLRFSSCRCGRACGHKGGATCGVALRKLVCSCTRRRFNQTKLQFSHAVYTVIGRVLSRALFSALLCATHRLNVGANRSVLVIRRVYCGRSELFHSSGFVSVSYTFRFQFQSVYLKNYKPPITL